MMNHANIRRVWDYYQATVKKIKLGDTASLEAAKAKLGYSLSELVPYLLLDVDTLSSKLSTANGDVSRFRSMLEASDAKVKQAEKTIKATDEKLRTSENNVERLTQHIKNGVRR